MLLLTDSGLTHAWHEEAEGVGTGAGPAQILLVCGASASGVNQALITY